MIPDVEKEQLAQKKATKGNFKMNIGIEKVVPNLPVANSDRKIEKQAREEIRKSTTDHKTSFTAKKTTNFKKYTDKESESSFKKENKTDSLADLQDSKKIKEDEEKEQLRREREEKEQLRREREEKEQLRREREEKEQLRREREEKEQLRREREGQKKKEMVHKSPSPAKKRKVTIDEPLSHTPKMNIKDKLSELDSKFELEKAKTVKKTSKAKLKKTMTINLKASSYPAKHRPIVIHLGICFEQIRIINVFL